MVYFLMAIFMTLVGCQQDSTFTEQESALEVDAAAEDDSELLDSLIFEKASCIKATSSQISVVNSGNTQTAQFLDKCGQVTLGSPWCQQLIRPNPSSISTFRCTYGDKQIHQLIHPDQNTWKHAYQAVNLIERLETNGVKVSQIYNWWRPEPYNKNVGGAPGRHPFGTSVDVRFASKSDQSKAHQLLCKWRKQGELRALGYYSGTALHFGIGDNSANTWGKSCP